MARRLIASSCDWGISVIRWLKAEFYTRRPLLVGLVQMSQETFRVIEESACELYVVQIIPGDRTRRVQIEVEDLRVRKRHQNGGVGGDETTGRPRRAAHLLSGGARP